MSDSDKKLLEKTKRILFSLGSYLKMELTNVDQKTKVFIQPVQRYLFVKHIITKDFTQALSMLVRFPNPFFQVRLLHTKYRISS